VSDQARAAGIKHPVALTEALWKIVSHCPDSTQTLAGRLWDTFWVFRLAAQKQTEQEVHFSVLFKTDEGTKEEELWAWCGPGDDEKPVITIMLEDED
jgi:hypothetical protein